PLRRLAARERALLRAQRLERPPEQRERLLREAGADLAGVDKAALVVVVADGERADPPAPAPLPRGPAADHQVLAGDVLHLHPRRAAAARLVRAVEPLRDDPLQPLVAGRREQGRAVAAMVGRRAPARSLELEL